MCGIIGILLSDKNSFVGQCLVDGLTMLQHRGQDAAGIVTMNDRRLHLRKDNGSVSEVFLQQHILNLPGNVGIGHVRYPTAGGSCSAEAQPLYTNSPYGIALAHNGNLINTKDLLEIMSQEHRHINTDSDSEVLLNIFAEELQRRRIRDDRPDEVFDAVRTVMRRCKGGYSVVMVINGIGLLAFRDPFGIRPLCFGTRKNISGQVDYAWASESVALDTLQPRFTLERDVQPGEAMLATLDGRYYSEVCHASPRLMPCIFEHVYFARPDSIMDGVSIYEARLNMGEKLAAKIMKLYPDHNIDVVIPIPDTARTSALQCAYKLNVPYREGFIKNRYIARTFIMPGQEVRKKTVRLKLNTIRSEFENRNVLLVDDSIVRGTTSLQLVQMAREAGAKTVYFASAAPAVRFPNVYGIDIPTREELIANGRSEDEIAKAINADYVIYNDLADLIDAVHCLNKDHIAGFDTSCFDGIYVTNDVTAEYLADLEDSRKGNSSSTPSTNDNTVAITPRGHPNGTPGMKRVDSACEMLHNNNGETSKRSRI